MDLGVNVDAKALVAKLGIIADKQVPFAAAMALTTTAWDAQRELTRQLPIKLDKPTNYTLKAFGVRKATKKELTAKVFIKPQQYSYLKYVIFDGIEQGKDGRRLAQPANIKLNKFGNIPGLRGGKKINTLLAKPNTFMGTVWGVTGVWQRVNKNNKLKLLIRFVDQQTHRAIFPYHKIIKGISKNKLQANLEKALKKAMLTAK